MIQFHFSFNNHLLFVDYNFFNTIGLKISLKKLSHTNYFWSIARYDRTDKQSREENVPVSGGNVTGHQNLTFSCIGCYAVQVFLTDGFLNHN